MVKAVLREAEDKMKKTSEVFRKELASLKAGRATPALLDKIMVDYYGTPTPVNQLSNLSVPEPRLLVIQPWDKSSLPSIEKAILKSDLGITPTSDGTVLRLNVPQLTTERRKELVKQLNKKAEEARVAVRNERREANEAIKRQKKDGKISEDDEKRAETDIQKLTDRYIREVDQTLAAKEKEVMEV